MIDNLSMAFQVFPKCMLKSLLVNEMLLSRCELINFFLFKIINLFICINADTDVSCYIVKASGSQPILGPDPHRYF